MAIAAGASALGLVGPMPSGPGMISNELIYEIAREVPPPISTFLLTSEVTVDGILSHYELTKTHTVQIVDKLENGSHLELREKLPAVKLVQVLHVIDDSVIDEALELDGSVDAFLLDSGNPNLETKVLGGTGNVHNWDISRNLVESVSVPVFLAGGLNPDNVKKAVEHVNPYGLDLCTGVRTEGRLDPHKLDQFFKAID